MIREGDNFDYCRWLRRVREEEAQENPATSGEFVAPEADVLPKVPACMDAWANAEPARPTKSTPIPRAVYRSDQKAKGESPKGRLKQRLVMVCNAWDDFQECRKRDAVYRYLKAVFALVVDCKGRRRTKRLLRRAFQFAGLPFDNNADPFATVIRCTSERGVDNKTISKWARALRYVARCKKPRTPLKRFVKKMGGINACAERYAIYISAEAVDNATFAAITSWQANLLGKCNFLASRHGRNTPDCVAKLSLRLLLNRDSVDQDCDSRERPMMMGRRERGQGQFFYAFDLDKVVPADHLVRQIDGVLDLDWVHKELAPYYSHTGRPFDRSWC